jgi:drug/metabolite transporter (DMT)-like permease
MSWFFLALIAPFLYALTNQIDKALLDKYFKVSGVGTLIIFSGVLSILALPVIYFFDPTVFAIGTKEMLIMLFVGILNLTLLWAYLVALKDDEASIIIVFYQLVPVFALVLGYYLLGETITSMQGIAMAIIIFGTTLVSFEINDDNNFKLKRQTVFFMLIASVLWALESVLFKYVALEENVLRSLFWHNLALAGAGVLVFCFIPKYRHHFLESIKVNSAAIFSVNVLNEIIYMVANAVYGFAYMLAPIALVLLTNSFQPIFVFAIGVFMTLYFPHIISEKIEAKHLWQKLLAIIITSIGTFILLSQ